MKVLFLDVDGVLNDRHTTEREPNTGYLGVDADKCALLRQIVSETDCRVVLSSTWRRHEKMLPYLYSALGDDIQRRIIGATPIMDRLEPGSGLYRGATREDEIAAWLKNWPCRFVILDDDPFMGELREHCVRTETWIGLTPDLAEQAIEKLNAQPTQ